VIIILGTVELIEFHFGLVSLSDLVEVQFIL